MLARCVVRCDDEWDRCDGARWWGGVMVLGVWWCKGMCWCNVDDVLCVDACWCWGWWCVLDVGVIDVWWSYNDLTNMLFGGQIGCQGCWWLSQICLTNMSLWQIVLPNRSVWLSNRYPAGPSQNTAPYLTIQPLTHSTLFGHLSSRVFDLSSAQLPWSQQSQSLANSSLGLANSSCSSCQEPLL